MLVARGFTEGSDIEAFFNSSLDFLHDPYLFKDMHKACELIRETLSSGHRVLIQGDYDCDGICGATILLETLQEMGAAVDYHVPDRFAEGYGLSMLAVERCIEEDFGLLISVDCGSSSLEEVARAKAAGIKVIVTDHHAVPAVPPEPDAFINPQQQNCEYPFKGVCGTGVAFKLVQALRGETGLEPRRLLDLVALATVADVVPLIDENRVLVQHGLVELNRMKREGLVALLEASGHSPRDVVDSTTLGFALGPRLNAAGRMENAKIGVELVRSRSRRESRELAVRLDSLNEERKEAEKAIQDEIEARFLRDPVRYQGGAIVEWGDTWHEGVLGITAGRLAERYGLPTLIIAVNGDLAKGSGRSPENVDLYRALCECGELFEKFGGHPRAGGFSLPSSKLDELRTQIGEACKSLRTGPAPVWVDSCLSLSEVDLTLVRELEKMEPFGEANPRPHFLLEGVDIVHQRLVGRAGDHLQLELEQAGKRCRAIAFRQAGLVQELKTQEYHYDLRCQLGRAYFRGQEQLNIQVSGVVNPTPEECSAEKNSVIDLRYLRGRKKALRSFLSESRDSLVICREPEKAESLERQFSGRFRTYENCEERGRALLLLAPPKSLSCLEALMTRVSPPRLVVLFGLQEIDKKLAIIEAARWTRPQAIELWRFMKRSTSSQFCSDSLLQRTEDKLRMPHITTKAILEAFIETGALKMLGDGILSFGQASGQKLEETDSFNRWKEQLQNLREVRDYFSGPGLSSRFKAHWECLNEREPSSSQALA